MTISAQEILETIRMIEVENFDIHRYLGHELAGLRSPASERGGCAHARPDFGPCGTFGQWSTTFKLNTAYRLSIVVLR